MIDTGDFYGMGQNEILIREALNGGKCERAFVALKFGSMRGPDLKILGDERCSLDCVLRNPGAAIGLAGRSRVSLRAAPGYVSFCISRPARRAQFSQARLSV